MKPTDRTNKKNERRGGCYWKGTKPYISVTTILSIVDKPSLRYWYGQQVYYAMVKDPTLEESRALKAPYDVSDKAKSRGTNVHSIVEAYVKNGVVVKYELEETEKQFGGYRDAFLKWVKELDITIVENEKTVFSEKYKYAGTLDILAKVNHDKETTLIDIKTGKDIYPESALQVSAYKSALEEQGIKIKECAILLLMENGTYKYEICGERISGFLAAQTLYEQINYEKLSKIGYFE
jgi:hypothetical protein